MITTKDKIRSSGEAKYQLGEKKKIFISGIAPANDCVMFRQEMYTDR